MDRDQSKPTGDEAVATTSTEPQKPSAPPSSDQQNTPAPPTSKPDKDEDDSDWEELDDVLDHFSASAKPASSSAPPKPDQSTPQPSNSQQEKPTLDQLPEPDEEALIKQLEAGMAELLGGAGGGDGAGAGADGNDDDWNALAQELAKSGMKPGDLMKLMMGDDDITAAADTGSSGGEASTGKVEDNFQDTIRKTMERMQESGEKATAAVNEGGDDDVMVQMLKAMEAAGMSGDGPEDEEGFEKMIYNMMQQLSSKEVLYEPCKELHDKFGPWLQANKEKLSKEEYEKYEKQSGLMAEVVAKFDSPGYSDDNAEHRAYVWEKMQEMQNTGVPPQELVADPFDGVFAGGENQQCPQQ